LSFRTAACQPIDERTPRRIFVRPLEVREAVRLRDLACTFLHECFSECWMRLHLGLLSFVFIDGTSGGLGTASAALPISGNPTTHLSG
jgi:hypothetical protein